MTGSPTELDMSSLKPLSSFQILSHKVQPYIISLNQLFVYKSVLE